MAVSRGSDEGQASQRRNAFNWRGALSYVVAYCVIAYVVSSSMSMLTTRSLGATKAGDDAMAASQVRNCVFASREHGGTDYLLPLAHPNDTFFIHVASDSNAFEPIVLDRLPFDASALHQLAPSATRQLNLSSCVAINCSLPAFVTMGIREHNFTYRIELIKFLPSKRVTRRKLLARGASGRLGGVVTRADDNASKELAAVGDSETRYVAYLQPSWTLSPVIDLTTPLPPSYHIFTPVLEAEGVYGPALYINDFWTLREHLIELNASSARDAMNVTVHVSPIAAWKVIFYIQYDQSSRQQREMGLVGGDEVDDMKRIFLDNNPYFLALTAVVSLLHMVFEYLAFSNDVRFWRGRKNFKGLSLRSVVINCYFQTIIFLYLYDTNETSWAILLPAGIGVLMEYWKLSQVVTLRRVRADSGSQPSLSVKLKDETASRAWHICGYEVSFKDSYDSRTRRHDETALRYLVLIMLPFLVSYSIYSMVYETHKSWYSYLVTTQVRFIYFFGFVMMTPQIFINYKMKSVGQLPWRTFVYKTLNTVIDDLFAFIIKMPWLHRIACFRDDVVFLILLYQRFMYPVDARRSADDEDGGEEATGDEVGIVPSAVDEARKRQ